jgi:hypothetical protein
MDAEPNWRNMGHFDGYTTEAEIKKLYRKLAFQRHPDHGGSTVEMQTLNAEYHAALAACNGQSDRDNSGRERRYWYDEKIEQAVMDKIAEILSARLPDIEVSLIGTWIWIAGNTKPVKEQLKAIGCKWHRERECWFWNAKPWHARSSNGSLESLALKYGVTRFENEKQERLN